MSEPRADRTTLDIALRAAFFCYVPVLFTATHWPELKIEAGDIPRPDLGVHLIAFGLLAFLALNAQLFGPRTSARNASLTALASAVYAAFDESTQAIPILKRTAVLDDFLANLLGVALGTLAGFALARAIAKGRGA